jgi:hypothetical protein
MTTVDDRTPEERKSHKWAVVARDPFMSGWGSAAGGTSRCGWACTPELLDTVEKRVRDRGDLRYVNVVNLDTYRPPRGTAHFHIYVANS